MISRNTRYLFLGISFFIISVVASAQSRKDQLRIDSVFSAIDKMPADSNCVNYINFIYRDYLWQFNLPESYNKLKYALATAQHLGFNRGELASYKSMASFALHFGNHDYELENWLNVLKVAERMNDSVEIEKAWFGVGVAYHSMGQDSLAIRFELDAARKLEQSSYKNSKAGKDQMARVYLFLAWTYQSLKNDSAALGYILKSLELRRELQYQDGLLSSFGTLRDIYISLHDYDKALAITDSSIQVELRRGNAGGTGSYYVIKGIIYELQHDPDAALKQYRKADSLAKFQNSKYLLRDLYKGFASALLAKGDSARSYGYFIRYKRLADSIHDFEVANQRAGDKAMYDIVNKNAQIDLLNKDKELQQKNIDAKKKTLWGMTLLLCITFALGVIVFSGYRRKKRSALLLAEQKRIIEEKNNDITNSIIYAQRIQQAILPSLSQIQKALPDSFVVYRPKDIVSGDFFWFTETKDSYYLAAVDCTGHGVPGAMMSMIGYNFLGQIVNEMHIASPNEILDVLHRKVLLALNKDVAAREIKDGMDVALCRIYKNKNEIEFSGAVRPLYFVEKGELQIIKGDMYSVGGIKDVDGESFSLHRFSPAKGSCAYLFSDGFADQFGGSDGKKFKYKRLRDLFLSVQGMPPGQQKKKIEATFDEWKGNFEQVDDVMVIGVSTWKNQ